jgi:primosomal protein N' (replication factor Y)
MKYAEVAVNSPIARRHSFCYSIPPQLTVSIGQAIWVPFGSKVLQGIVVKLSDIPSVETTREIIGFISSRPLLSPVQVQLALWLSEYYLAPLFDAVALMLPPGFEQKVVTFLQLLPQSIDLSQFTAEQGQVVRFFEDGGTVKVKELERRFGKGKAVQIIRELIRRHVLAKSEQLEEIRVRPKLTRYLKLELSGNQVEEKIQQLRKTRAYKQAAVVEFLAGYPKPISFMELSKNIACQWSVIMALNERGVVSIFDAQVRRDPLAHLKITPTLPLELIPSQEIAWQTIHKGLVSGGDINQPRVFLLVGVTGSGKTEIYLRALAEVVSQGRRGICMVPEIALTPQTIERFASRFTGRVAVLHSGLSLGEQFDEWHRIQGGDCDVVIGPRSALFAPQPDLALIIIDEEHEWTYKQADKTPRYHAREVAVKLSQLTGATVILGSATPDVTTFYRAQQGEYQLVELKERITPRGVSPLPEVEVVDTRNELKAGNRSLFSRSLSGAMSEVLSRGEQVILFLNRRGAANFIRCQVCGYVPGCPRCMVALTYHSATGKLVCHHCNYYCLIPQVCSQCFSPQLKYFGIGTQKVEQETSRLFPQAKILRWDRDITVRRQAHEEILAKFKAHEADVLIGTQMIAKGLDLPQVTLAGVISADTGLNLPDFRAGERTFQLVCQVAGRAGRGFAAGRVVVQTYCPEHYAIKAAARHDYLGFYNQEIKYRHQFGYPPFSQLARLVFSHTNFNACRFEADKMHQLLNTEKNRKGIADLRIIGPVPAYVPRIRGRYQWQIILCGVALSEFLAGISFPQAWIIDVDPVSVI